MGTLKYTRINHANKFAEDYLHGPSLEGEIGDGFRKMRPASFRFAAADDSHIEKLAR
jgi:hypothetical protein